MTKIYKDGTLASKTYPDGKKITYDSYNENKALTNMTDYLGNTTTYTNNASWNWREILKKVL